MNYKETLFFIAKCLTVNYEKTNLKIVKNQLKNNSVNWDSVVKVSTNHFVFPALYCNLKKANLLSFLPSDLVEYMQHITQLNRERNLEIIKQVEELNIYLQKNNITPIFLKGVGFIFQDIYDDIAERMIADIDFVISKDSYLKTISLVKSFGYSKLNKHAQHSPLFKHYPRLQKEGCSAAVEIHKEILIDKFSKEFNYEVVKNKCIKSNNITVLSYDNQLSLSILANQINDDGFYYKNLTLKHAYDVYLLSKKTNAKKAFEQFNELKYPLNCFLASSYQVFNNIESLAFDTTMNTKKYLKDFNTYLINHKKRIKDYKKIKLKLSLIRKKDFIFKVIFQQEYRNWYVNNFLIKLKLKRIKG
ncbi:nucleotidyltransferase family protein [uncultured Polaribacter sp.]|uniref:nucleotidyltransferase family protein n=1 Tax=uncultured Polaribacter sp. TaxID=174711 RepID=UPI00262779E5|nr:nucleotidyltransferase family protein [uncultured Polaribacter sp.]